MTSGTKKKILIIEDERDVRELIKLMLEEKAGFEVLCAESISDAFEVVKKNAIEGIIIERFMLKSDSEAENLFPKLQATNAAPIGFYGYEETFSKEELSKADSILFMPFGQVEFCEWVKELCLQKPLKN